MTSAPNKRAYTFRGPAGARTVTAASEEDARHLAMVAVWGLPGSRAPREDTGSDGRYLSRGLYLESVA